jgi:hypothetical protein
VRIVLSNRKSNKSSGEATVLRVIKHSPNRRNNNQDRIVSVPE